MGVLLWKQYMKKITEAFASGYSGRNSDGCIVIKRERHFRRRLSPVRIPYLDDFVVASYTRDLHARRGGELSEEKLLEVRMRLKALLDAAPLCLNLWDQRISQRILLQANEALKLFELDSELQKGIILSIFNLLSLNGSRTAV